MAITQSRNVRSRSFFSSEENKTFAQAAVLSAIIMAGGVFFFYFLAPTANFRVKLWVGAVAGCATMVEAYVLSKLCKNEPKTD